MLYSNTMIVLMCIFLRVWPFHLIYPSIHSLVHPPTHPSIHPPIWHPSILTTLPICLLQVARIYMGSKELVHRCVDKPLKDLQVDYIDLYLIHYPCGFKVRFGHCCSSKVKTLKTESYHDANFVVVSGGTTGCHHDNLRCHHWQYSWHNEKFRFSVSVIFYWNYDFYTFIFALK